jgi:hypothetical protein
MSNTAPLTAPHATATLLAHGLRMPAPEQVYVDRSVALERISPQALLFPGARVAGERTLIQANARIGSEGPATVYNCAFGPDSAIASGFAADTVLLAGASLGGAAHARPATLLEEGASTAHCVGLKQSVLMSFVTLGSLINACDLLIAGGTSREDHSEVGSGFIHFNFTPWGAKGDKATASLVGNVCDGVFLRQRRVFLGGLSGLVGPVEVEFGAITVAGQVVRKKVARNRLSGATPRAADVDLSTMPEPRLSEPKIELNCRYIGELCALRAWYRQVRVARAKADADALLLLQAGEQAIAALLRERIERLGAYCGVAAVRQREAVTTLQQLVEPPVPPLLLQQNSGHAHLDWLRALPDTLVEAGSAWLHAIAADGTQRSRALLGIGS